MDIIWEKSEGSRRLTEDTQLSGMIVGAVEVSTNVTLHLQGMVIGNVTIEENGTVYLRGMVVGDVTNAGGRLEVYGMIVGRLIRLAGDTVIDLDAKIVAGPPH